MKRYNVEYVQVAPCDYYTLSLCRFRAIQQLLSTVTAADVRNVLLADLRDTLFQVSVLQSTTLLHMCFFQRQPVSTAA